MMIELNGVSKAYDNGKLRVPVLKDIHFSIASGDYVGMLGKSGSGKSTLLNIIGFLDSATSGSYFFEGEEVAQLSNTRQARLRNQKIGFVFQSFHLLPRASALENVMLPLQYRGDDVRRARALALECLARVGLADRAKHRPNELSGGQRQRVAIARALVTSPALLIADEPTGNLDADTNAQIMALFADLHRDGSTILMVTHDPDVAAHCARQVEIVDGVVRQSGKGKGEGASA